MLYAVIMAGGSGTRFWPLSREKSPKQLLTLVDGETLLENTVSRILPLVPHENIFIVTVAPLKKKILALLPELPEENIIPEPIGRNTAPAIGLAALHIKKRDPDGVMVVLPADHLIKKESKFLSVLKKASKVADKSHKLVALGMKPDYPETGYGYIQSGEQLSGQGTTATYSIKKFTEKPDLETAEKFTKRDDYYWNAGIFIWKNEFILKEFEKHLPELFDALLSVESSIGSPRGKATISKVYRSLESISIDHGVMERSEAGAVIPCEVGWNDLGSWLALADILKKDKSGNAVRGEFLGIDAKNCIIHSEGKLVAGIGIEDLVIVTTRDTVLVCPKNQSQRVKEMVSALKARDLKHLT